MKHLARYIIAGSLLIGVVVISVSFTFSNLMTSQQNAAVYKQQKHQNEGAHSEQPAAGVTGGTVDYGFKNKKLFVTFDKEKSWHQVPAKISEFFSGEYETAIQNTFLPDTYRLEKDNAGFLVSKGERADNLTWLYTTDQGENWQEALVFSELNGVRFRKIQFLDDGLVFAFASSGRVAGQEGCVIARSLDNGATWTELPTKALDDLSMRIVQAATFIDQKLGFVSKGTNAPELIVTQDGGQSFQKADIQVPEQYQEIFVTCEAPFLKDNKIYVWLNQGTIGDYKGGEIKGLFVSEDNGLTFKFVKEGEES
jgi:hypothetical protein